MITEAVITGIAVIVTWLACILSFAHGIRWGENAERARQSSNALGG